MSRSKAQGNTTCPSASKKYLGQLLTSYCLKHFAAAASRTRQMLHRYFLAPAEELGWIPSQDHADMCSSEDPSGQRQNHLMQSKWIPSYCRTRLHCTVEPLARDKTRQRSIDGTCLAVQLPECKQVSLQMTLSTGAHRRQVSQRYCLHRQNDHTGCRPTVENHNVRE